MERLRNLPYSFEFTNLDVYKHLSEANINLGELKGLLRVIDNSDTIIHLLKIKEITVSSKVEKPDSSYDKIFMNLITSTNIKNQYEYTMENMDMLLTAFETVKSNSEISIDVIHKIQSTLLPMSKGVRTTSGHKIYNKLTNEVLHIPPQDTDTILDYYRNLLFYINHQYDNYDPLIKMSLIHFQFESIHPYKDGNSIVARILDVLYLGLYNRIDYPFLNLGDYIVKTKDEYNYLLRKGIDNPICLPEFIVYILKGVTKTTVDTINFIISVNSFIKEDNRLLKYKCDSIYDERIIPHIYKNLYTKNLLFREDLGISRSTATKYLKMLEREGFLSSFKVGKEVLYKNNKMKSLFNIKSHQ